MIKGKKIINKSNIQIISGILIYLFLIVVFIIVAPKAFIGYRIYMAFLSTVPFSLLMALPLTFLIIIGEIDLSFPGVLCFSGFIFAYILSTTGSSILALLVCLVAGFIMGFINGILVTKLKTPSIIITLAMQFVWIGAAQILSGANVQPIEKARDLLINKILVGRIGGVFPVQALWAFAIAIVLGIILNRHRFGENVMVIGDNSATAKMMGINVDRTIIAVFSMTGLLAAFSSTLLTLDMASWWPTFGPGYLLVTIAAVFLGGTSIYGGEGSVFGTVIGAFIMGSMTAGIVASGVGEVWISFAQGMVLIFAILLNTFINRKVAI